VTLDACGFEVRDGGGGQVAPQVRALELFRANVSGRRTDDIAPRGGRTSYGDYTHSHIVRFLCIARINDQAQAIEFQNCLSNRSKMQWRPIFVRLPCSFAGACLDRYLSTPIVQP
jgi:hypothetical protein